MRKFLFVTLISVLMFVQFSAQNIYTFAGNGTFGYSGDGGAATNAQLSLVQGIAVDGLGNIYVADQSNNRIRKITPSGIISTCVGTGIGGYSGDGGPAINAQISTPYGISIDASGNLFIADFNNSRIRKVNTSGIISTVAGDGTQGFGGDGGPATNAQLNAPVSVAVDAAGNLYIADFSNYRIRKVTPAGIISTIAGNGTAGFSGDGSTAVSAQLDLPYGVAVDVAGNVYIADQNNHRVRKVNLSGIITTYVGTGVAGFSGDGGIATNAKLNFPYSLAFDLSDNLLIADRFNNKIRKVSAGNIISTAAGNGVGGFSGDGNLATNAQLNDPAGIAITAVGTMFISDKSNFRIREVCASGCLTNLNTLIEINPGVLVFPNPSIGSLTIRIDATLGDGKLTLYNFLGQKVLEQNILTETNHINLVNFANGLYSYTIEDAGLQIHFGKIIIE
ncbi:MAG: T9SS type A sorting domain-containing protein [Sphingobacteriaceae bacterium]|nr:T9SS type A sorting domain-containing protein [Sphingobacteriaceae bacterium]